MQPFESQYCCVAREFQLCLDAELVAVGAFHKVIISACHTYCRLFPSHLYTLGSFSLPVTTWSDNLTDPYSSSPPLFH